MVKSHTNGQVKLLKYADDFMIIAKQQKDAERIYAVLGKRLAKFGLAINEEKTRIVHFGPHIRETFNFLGFTHYWGKFRKGRMIPKRKTAKDRIAKTAKNFKDRCGRMFHKKEF